MTEDEIQDRIDIIRSSIYADDRQTWDQIDVALVAMGQLVVELYELQAETKNWMKSPYCNDDPAMIEQDRICNRVLRGHAKPGCKCRYCKAIQIVSKRL